MEGYYQSVVGRVNGLDQSAARTVSKPPAHHLSPLAHLSGLMIRDGIWQVAVHFRVDPITGPMVRLAAAILAEKGHEPQPAQLER